MKLNTALYSPDDQAPNETGGGQEAKPQAGGGPEKISVTREEYEQFVAAKSQLSGLAGEKKVLEERWNDAQKLLRTDLPAAETEAAMRRVMAAAGRSPEEIESQLASLRGDTEEEEPRSRRGREGDDEVTATVKRQQQELEQLKSQAQKNREAGLRSVLDLSVKSALDTNKDLDTLVRKLASVQDDDGTKTAEIASSIRATFRGEVTDALKKRLARRRVEAGGQWDDSWIELEGPAAAKEVVAKYRTLIGDPSKLGRSSDAETGYESLISSKPVPAPKWKPGMNETNAGNDIRGWAVDSLLRGAVETGTTQV